MIINLPIDTKSLYLNVYNDNEKGHTPTVATPIKQQNSENEQLKQVFRIPKQINFHKNQELVNKLVSKSKSKVIIKNVFVFDKISVNGVLINNRACFCLFVKEEIDEKKVQYGRIKLHYPKSLTHEDEELSIDNREVLNLVSLSLNNYAFIVNSFDFDFQSEILNFDCSIVGENLIPYSKVFINNKGVGSKYNDAFYEYFDNYDVEGSLIRKKSGRYVDSQNYIEIIRERKTQILEELIIKFQEEGIKRLTIMSNRFPYSLYDIEGYKGKKKIYYIVVTTASQHIYFDFSMAKFIFADTFQDNFQLVCVTDSFGDYKINIFSFDDLLSFQRKINSMRFLYE